METPSPPWKKKLNKCMEQNQRDAAGVVWLCIVSILHKIKL